VQIKNIQISEGIIFNNHTHIIQNQLHLILMVTNGQKKKAENRESKSVAPCKSVRWGFIRRTNINKYNETPLSVPAGIQSCTARVSHPPEASLA
jgi:hypothetical protein